MEQEIIISSSKYLMKDIVFLGPQGAGKWTQSRKIMNFFSHFFYFESGAILRALRSSPNALGTYIKNKIDAWEMVDDIFITKMFESYMLTLPKDKLMLLDWYPRSLHQAYQFIDLETKFAKRDFVVIYLDVPQEESIRRISGRRVCNRCGMIVNIYSDWEVKSCQRCWWELVQRHDDKPELVKRRLELYHQQTKPLVELFENLGVLKKIDGTQSPDQVFEQIKDIILND